MCVEAGFSQIQIIMYSDHYLMSIYIRSIQEQIVCLEVGLSKLYTNGFHTSVKHDKLKI